MKKSFQAVKIDLLVLIGYLLLSLLMTYPLVTKFTTHNIGGGGDDMIYLWNLWWVKHAIMDLGVNPLYTDYIFYPHKIGLALHDLQILNGILSIPFHYVTDIVVIYNFIAIVSFVLTGYATFLLVNHLTKDWRAAFIGGLIFSCYRATVTGGFGMTQWMPFYAFFLLRTFEPIKDRRRNALWAGIMLGCAFLSNYYYFIYLILFTAVYISFRVSKDRKEIYPALKKVAIIGVSSAPFVFPLLFFSIKEVLRGNSSQPVLHNIVGADIFSFLMPYPQHAILGGLKLWSRVGGNVQPAYIGLCAAALGVLGWIKFRKDDRSVRFWGLSFAAFMVLSLGSYPHVLAREIKIPLPFLIFTYVPGLENIRVPSRFIIFSVLSISILAAYGVLYLLKKNKYFAALLIPVILLDYSSIPIGVNDAGIPEYYEIIRRDRKAQAVLEIPFYVQDGVCGVPLMGGPIKMQFYQSRHGKKIFNGIVSRTSPKVLLSYLNLPVFRTIALIEAGNPYSKFVDLDELMRFEAKAGRDVMNLLGIDYVIIHKGYEQFNDLHVHMFLKSVFPMEKLYEDKEAVVYRTLHESPDELFIDVGTERSIPYLYSGWINGLKNSELTFALSEGNESVLLLNLTSMTDYEMRFRAASYKSIEGQEISMAINGRHFTDLLLRRGWNDYSVVLPGGLIVNGLNKITFKYSKTFNVNGRFEGGWPQMALSQYLNLLTLDGSKAVVNWEQHNGKFLNPSLAVAYDFFKIKGRI